MRKYLIFLILVLMMASLSAVSAAENATDIADDAILQEDNITEPPVVENVQDTSIDAQPATGYEQFSSDFTVTLTSNGTPLVSKPVSIAVDGVNYNKTTDSKGQASISAKLTKGTYDVSFSFAGDADYAASNGTAKWTIKSPIKTSLKVADKYINYRHAAKTAFIVRLVTSSGAGVKNQTVTVKAGGKTYSAKTDSSGYATVFISLKKGTRKITYSFKSNSPYLSSSGSHTVKVKSSIGKGYGYWLWGDSMKRINLKTLKNKGTKHLFLHSYSIDLFGKSTVKSWIAKAKKYGMKVHIWMQVFYNGKWISPINSDGSFKYSYMKKQISLAQSYAKIKGVAGIHLDYVRFGGTAYRYDDSVKAINYFVKKACNDVRKVSPNCIMSASIMPEPGMTEDYYGQSIPSMTKYLDVIIPMEYKGNYKKKTTWIKYVTSSFVLDSYGAQVWAGLQAYKSDSNPKKLSASELCKDARAAIEGGAKGVVLFRIGVTNLLNFNKV